MAILPSQWDAYGRLQQQSSKKSSLDHQYWAVDAGMAALLEAQEAGETMGQHETERAISNAARLERYRAQLRVTHLHHVEDDADYGPGPDARAVEALELLQIVAEALPEDDWALLVDVAREREYSEIGAERGVSAGSLRTRVSRLREAVRAIV